MAGRAAAHFLLAAADVVDRTSQAMSIADFTKEKTRLGRV